MKKTWFEVVVGFGSIAVLAGLAAWASSQRMQAASRDAARSRAQAEVPYEPSEYPNVLVRNAPKGVEESSQAGRAGWVYKEPGAAMPSLSAVRKGTPTIGQGRTPGGGVILHTNGTMTRQEAARASSEGVVTSCERMSHLHSKQREGS